MFVVQLLCVFFFFYHQTKKNKCTIMEHVDLWTYLWLKPVQICIHFCSYLDWKTWLLYVRLKTSILNGTCLCVHYLSLHTDREECFSHRNKTVSLYLVSFLIKRYVCWHVIVSDLVSSSLLAWLYLQWQVVFQVSKIITIVIFVYSPDSLSYCTLIEVV